MKKIILSLGATLVATASLVGCNQIGSDGSTTMDLYMLVKMESRDQQTAATPVVSTYTYKQIEGKQPNPNEPYRFSALPKLVSQEITGDTLKRITYSYNKEQRTLTATRYGVNDQVWVDSLGLNEQGMATTLLRDGQVPVPYSISYPQGAFMRSGVGEITLTTGQDPYVYTGEVYRSATIGGEVVAEYFYKTMPNLIQLQQYTIPGAPYYWATDHFGRQSLNLLDYALIKEGGVQVRYDFGYQLNELGFVVQEMIKRDNVVFRVNSYSYARGTIELE